MLKIIATKWGENSEKLREALLKMDGLNTCNYIDLVKISFDIILNDGQDLDLRFDTDKITEIDDGDYQGTLLFLIPFDTYQPCAFEYLMTYVEYGSCSVCDTLQFIQDDVDYDERLTEEQVKDYMTLCKGILQNTIKPYNLGWKNDERFDQIEFE